MLTTLRIENLAVIAECDIEFNSGFTVLTGETGAGKSIVIDAISLLMGHSGDEGLIRTGADAAVVEGAFFLPDPTPELAALMEDSNELIVYRRISRGKPAITRINGQAIPLKQLRQVMKSVVGITGQHDQLALFGAEYQLRLIDQFANAWGIETILTEYKANFREWTDVTARYNSLVSSEGQLAQKIDFLQFQIDDISQHQLKDDEEETLNGIKKDLNHRTLVVTQLKEALSALNQLTTVSHRYITALKKVVPVLDQFNGLLEAANDMQLMAEDHSDQLERYRQATANLDQMDVDAVEARLDILFKLKTKYKALDLHSLLHQLEVMKAERDELLQFESTSTRLEAQRETLLTRLHELATAIHEIRERAGAHISESVSKKLEELGFNQADFKVQLDLDLSRLTATGATVAEMQIAPNPGEDRKALGKVASGGELSRIMLAVNSVFFELNPTPTLIFDEVDAGVGGLTALRIGELLKLTSKSAQVFCITHLPQIAQNGDHHLLIEKQVREGQTFTVVTSLASTDRTDELRRMVGGDAVVAKVARG